MSSEPTGDCAHTENQATPLQFPAVARLELDELLDQLIERAGEMRAAQGRLHGLLRATQYVAADLDLDEVLSRLVDAARELIGSQWASLGLLHDGLMTQVVHRPEDDALVGMLRRLPPDTGVLGWRVDDPRSARIDDLVAHPDAIDEVRRHRPAIRSFMRAPVRAGSTTYGNLYLADERAGVFRDDDQQLLVALAAAAGVAVRNAMLLARTDRQQRWNQAGIDLARRLLAEDVELAEAWNALLEVAVDFAEAHSATLTVIDAADPDSVDVVAAAGALAPLQGRTLADEKSLTRAVVDTGRAVIVRDVDSDPRTAALKTFAPEVASVLAAPLPPLDEGDETFQAVLTVTRRAGQDGFRDLDTDMIRGFATQAATTLALARARHDRERLQRLEDREHTLTGLQHSVISQLQRSTLTIANVAGQVDPRFRTMLLDQIESLERLVRGIRDTMFDVPR